MWLGKLTGVDSINDRPEERDGEKEQREPTIVHHGNTARDAIDRIPTEMHQLMKHHLQRGRTHTKQQIHHRVPPSLRLGEHHTRVVRIQHLGQPAQHGGKTRRQRDLARILDLDLDVAEAAAGEPGGGVVGGPDEGVEEGAGEQDDDPGHEAGGADVAVAEVPDEWGCDEEDEEEGGEGEEDGGGVDLRWRGGGRAW